MWLARPMDRKANLEMVAEQVLYDLKRNNGVFPSKRVKEPSLAANDTQVQWLMFTIECAQYHQPTRPGDYG
jgi:hypothetical protein